MKPEEIARHREEGKLAIKAYYLRLKKWRPNPKNKKCPICNEIYDKVRQPCCYEIFDHGTWICEETPAVLMLKTR